MLCPTCSTRNSPESRYCSQCGSALTMMCSSCGRANDRKARFCSECGNKLRGDENGRPAQSIPSASQQGHPAERRQLTVMFCDLVGSTERSTRLDAEDLQEVIAAYHACVGPIVQRLDGHIAQYL